MVRRRSIVLVIGFFCGLVSADGGQSPPPRSDPLGSLKKEVDDAYAAFSQAYGKKPEVEVEACWQTYMRVVEKNCTAALELIREAPKSSQAFAVLDWIVSTPRNLQLPFGEQAVKALLQGHAEDPRIGPACGVLGYYGDALHQPTLDLLRTVSEKNPDRGARGQATLGLARLTYQKAKYFDRQKKGDPVPLYREAERLCESTLEAYGDCPDLRRVGVRRAQKTLGEEAARDLFEMRELVIGKVVPEVSGEDLDGKPLRLSDFRGKVVVLTFWADWCGPCMAMVPHERDLVARMKGRPFALIGVNGDEDRSVAKATVATNRMTWPSFWNGGPNGPITGKWNVQSWPTIYVMDHRGVIRFKQVREKKMDEAVDLLVKEVEEEQNSGEK